MEGIVAVDIGTTGAKAALVNRAGALVAQGFAGYATHTAAGGVVEQESEAWWQATCEALQALWADAPAGCTVAAVTFSGQMQDLILLGEAGAVAPAILYADSRAQAEAATIQAQLGEATLVKHTGNAQGATSLLAKWRWLIAHAPQTLAAARALLPGAHDYVTWRLCGAVTTDGTTAATTGLLDLAQNAWAGDLLAALGLDAGLLPQLRVPGDCVGTVTPAAAAATGLPAGTPVLQGAGDLGASTVGAGAGLPGRVYCYLGTSGWIAASLDQATPRPDQGVFTLRHPDGVRFIQVAPMLTAGGNLDWLRQALLAGPDASAASYAETNRLAALAAPGSSGVIYLPYLNGERSPFSDPGARAGFLGIAARTTRNDLARAVLEGTALAYRALRDTLGVAAGGALYVTGGGGNSALWMQILAAVLACPVQVLAAPGDAPARGAAILAGNALGWYRSLAPGDDFFPVTAVFAPDSANARLYDQLYAVFRQIYPQLRTTFAALAAIPAP